MVKGASGFPVLAILNRQASFISLLVRNPR
jgi:hypothetical protein